MTAGERERKREQKFLPCDYFFLGSVGCHLFIGFGGLNHGDELVVICMDFGLCH